MNPLHFLLLAWITAVLVGDEPPRFKTTTRKSDDRVEIKAAKGQAAFSIHCPSGIGAATIERLDAAWPETVVLRLQLKGLESLAITGGKVKLGAAVSSERKIRLWKDDQEDVLLTPPSPYWMEIRIIAADGKPARVIPVENGWFEMTLPRAWFEGNPKAIVIQWIDFYRG